MDFCPTPGWTSGLDLFTSYFSSRQERGVGGWDIGLGRILLAAKDKVGIMVSCASDVFLGELSFKV